MFNTFSLALSFLTIFRLPFSPSPMVSAGDLAKSFSFYPLIGYILGLCWLAPAYLLSKTIPHLLLAALLTALMALLTRALHLDGLADLADGIGGGYTPEKRLEIMKDSRIGAFGALALILAVLLKAASLSIIIQNGNWPPLVLIPVLSRFGMVLMAYRSPYARKEGGLGKAFMEHITTRELTVAAAISLSLLLVSGLFPFYLAAVLFCVATLRHLSTRCLGGVTGDVLGATNELCEIALLSLAACYAPT